MSNGDGSGFTFDPSKLTGQDKAKWQFLTTNFNAAFNVGPGNLGLPGGTFDYNAWLNNPDYRNNITHLLSRDPQRSAMRQQALNDVLSFIDTQIQGTPFERGGGKIDPREIFDPLKGEIRNLASQSLQFGKSQISQQARGATRRATEALAGTGLGRSGVAAGAFSGIEQQRSGAVERLLQRVQTAQSQAELQVEQRIADLTFSEELRQRGADEAFINDALNFRRQVDLMQFQTLFEIAAEDAKGSGWGDFLGLAADLAVKFIPT